MSQYPPHYHTETDDKRLFDAIDAIRFATLLVAGDDGLQVSFTPFFADRARRVLRGHIAARNPQAEQLEGKRIDVIFHGPHAYISPQLNHNEDVPTWNYVNVHVRGRVRMMDAEEDKWRMMQEFVHAMEQDNASAYFAAYETRLKPMLRAIRCFEVDIEQLVGRFKLGRNDPAELQQKTFAVLQQETPSSLQGWLATLAP